MTVKELIEELNKYSPDYDVYIGCVYDDTQWVGGNIDGIYSERIDKTVYIEHY